MPSVLVGNPFLSGYQTIVSGNWFSGRKAYPEFAYMNLKWFGGNANPNSGLCFISLSGPNLNANSGGPSVTSGGLYLAGGGNMDGMPMFPLDSYSIPAALFTSGTFNVCAIADTLGSGGRLYFEFDTHYQR